MSSPLFDTLFRPTTVGTAASAAAASAPPVRVRGTRTRAGNAMDRTRSALLAGAGRAVEVNGTRITMAQVAAAAGVAKATLYNHFRTRETVLVALVTEQARLLVEEHAGKPLEHALTDAAVSISEHPLRRTLSDREPAALAALGRIDADAEGWRIAREGVAKLLAAADRAGVDLVLRWLASFVLTPADRNAVSADVAMLVAGLPRTLVSREPLAD
jgi:AcrR family transcriptional regulator